MAKIVWVDCPVMDRRGSGKFPHYAACIAALPFARQIKADAFAVKEKGVRKATYSVKEVEEYLLRHQYNKALMNMGHAEPGPARQNLASNGQVLFRGSRFQQPPTGGLYRPSFEKGV